MTERSIERELHHGRYVRVFKDRPGGVYNLLRRAADNFPDDIALTEGDRSIQYGELDNRVEQVARSALRSGISSGCHVGLLMANSIDAVIVLFAMARLGVRVVPMNTRQVAGETVHMLEDSSAVALIYDTAGQASRPDPALVPSVLMIEASSLLSGHPGEERLPALPGEDEVFCILYTSGSTGRPKGALLTNMGIVVSCIHYVDAFSLTRTDSVILAVPLCHVTGLVSVLLTAVAAGGRVVIMERFRAGAYLDIAVREKTSYAFMVPAMYTLCLMQGSLPAGLENWRVAAYGGAPMPEITIRALRAGAPQLQLYNVYGATEVTSPATILPALEAELYPDSCGRALPCVDLLVVDENEQEVPRGEIGEILIGGPNVSPGYWNNEASSEAGFREGFWRSGDLGSLDADGLLRVKGRIKEVVNRGGYKIYPAEVENALNRHPAVLEAAVLGLPDFVLGQRTYAYIVANSTEVTATKLCSHCAEHLADYKVPDAFVVTEDAVPRMENGKIDKARLRSILAEQAINVRRKPSESIR